MGLSTIDGDLRVSGTFTAGTMSVPASSVGDSEVEAAANVASSKLEHFHNINAMVFDHATDVVTRRIGVFCANSVCTIDEVAVYVTVAAGAATTVAVDLLKNGSTILTGTMDITNALAAHTLLAGTLESATLAADDKLEISATLTGTNEPKGLNAVLRIRERGY